MMRAAVVTTRPVVARPYTMAPALSAPPSQPSRMRRDEEHLVVHGQTKEHGEQEGRYPTLDLRNVVQAEEVVAHPVAEHDHGKPVAGEHRPNVEG